MILLLPQYQFFIPDVNSNSSPAPADYFNFQLTDASRISISGTSNVNEFNCLAYQDYASGNGIVEKNETSGHLKFQHTTINILVKSLSCDNQVMDYDMYQALKSEKYPYITLNLKEAFAAGNQKIDLLKNIPLIVTADLSVAGMCRSQTIQINASQNSNGQLIFHGTHKIKLEDFNIDPPTALFGVIKVRDEVYINFDLYVEVK